MKKLLLISLFGLIGCVVRTQTVRVFRFNRADTTQAIFLQDRYFCIREAQQEEPITKTRIVIHNDYADRADFSAVRVISANLYLACMNDKGYIFDEEGEFSAPPNEMFVFR